MQLRIDSHWHTTWPGVVGVCTLEFGGYSRNRPKLTMRNSDPVPVTWQQVTSFRLRRQHLSERAPASKLLSVAGDMTGAQAQLLSAAQISLWSRLRDLRLSHIDTALKKRTLVKAACMRRTLFLVPSRDLAIFARGTARRAEKEVQWTLRKGVPARVVDSAIAAALAALDQPRTRVELADRVSRALGVQSQSIHGGGWGSRRKVAAVPVGHLIFPVVDLLHLVAARGVVCYGPYRGNEPTFVRADAWVARWKDVPQETAEELLLRRYLRTYGPATVADFALWSGLTLREAKEIWGRIQSDLVPIDIEGRAAMGLRQDVADLTGPPLEDPPVRLLPYFDVYLLGHRERDHLVARQHHAKIYRPQGWIAPTVLVHGRVRGIWQYSRERDQLRIQVEKLASLPRAAVSGMREEARELARFLDTAHVDFSIGQAGKNATG